MAVDDIITTKLIGLGAELGLDTCAVTPAILQCYEEKKDASTPYRSLSDD